MADVEFKPLNDKIVVKPQARVKSSILQVIMDEADNMGIVVAVGRWLNHQKAQLPKKPILDLVNDDDQIKQ